MLEIFNPLFRFFFYIKANLLNNRFSNRNNSISLALGVYVAFCPFIGFHTAMMIAFAWLFSLNAPLMIGVSYCINNPWTMIPVYFGGYWFGLQLLGVMGLEGLSEPLFMVSINTALQTYFNMNDINLWAFLLGGNLLGVCLGIMSYVITYVILEKIRS